MARFILIGDTQREMQTALREETEKLHTKHPHLSSLIDGLYEVYRARLRIMIRDESPRFAKNPNVIVGEETIAAFCKDLAEMEERLMTFLRNSNISRAVCSPWEAN